jgi:hypothetical protein
MKSLRALFFSAALFLAPAAQAQIVLPGGGSGGGASGVSSIATNCPASGPQTGAVTVNGYVSNSRSNSGATDTLVAGDCGGIVQETNAGSVAVSIAAAGSTGFSAPGYLVGINNFGLGSVVVTPASGTINGAATLTVGPGCDTQLVAFSSGAYITMNGAGACATATAPTFSPAVATYRPLWGPITVGNGAAETISTALCAPFIAPLAQHWDQIVTSVATAGSSNVQFAIYPDGLNSTSGVHQPVGAAIYSSSSIADTGSTPFLITWPLGTSGIGQAITQGPNWICLNTGDSTVLFQTVPATTTYIAGLIGGLTPGHNNTFNQNTTGLKITQTFGTWPTFTTSSAFTEVSNNTVPQYYYRIATTP